MTSSSQSQPVSALLGADWRPMATAPKNGPDFLAMNARGDIRRCWRSAPSSRTDEIRTFSQQRFAAVGWIPLWGPTNDDLRRALILARDRLRMLMPATLDGSDHPGATEFVISRIEAALSDGALGRQDGPSSSPGMNKDSSNDHP